jgi:hypothetical protein
MNIHEMICKLENEGLKISVMNDPYTLHVDGYHPPQSKGLPDWLWNCKGWGVSSCGFARVFMFKMK